MRVRESGLTLIESIVSIALLTVAVAGIAAGVAGAEKLALINQDQSQLEVAMRQLSDFVRDSTPSSGLIYDACSYVVAPPTSALAGTTSPGSSAANMYSTQLANAVASNKLITPPGKWGFKQILESGSSGATVTTGSLSPYSTTGCQTGTGSSDWGVQKIQLVVFDRTGTRSLTRWVWKSFAWCYQVAAGAC